MFADAAWSVLPRVRPVRPVRLVRHVRLNAPSQPVVFPVPDNKKTGRLPGFFIDELLLYIKGIEPVSYTQFQIGGVARLNGDVFTVTGDFVADFSRRDFEADFDTGLAVAADNFLVDESLE